MNLRSLVRASLLAGLLLHGCAATPGDGASYRLEVAGEDVTLQFQNLPIHEIVHIAQDVTRRIYVYDAREIGEAGPFTIAGELHCKRAEFDDFLATMLHVHGLVVVLTEQDGVPVRRITRA